MAKRAFTMVELLFVVALTSLVLGATVGLYGFTMTRLAQGAARFSTEDQARKILDEIEAVVRDSSSVTLVSSGGQTGLRCTLAQASHRPANVKGSADARVSKTADPVGVTRRAWDKHGSGRRVWFYTAGATGDFGTAGTHVWRAERNDDGNPTAADVVSGWSNYYGSTSKRFPLVTAITFSVDLNNRTATATVTARSLWRDERSGNAADKDSQSFTESRTIVWRHWFR
jgi:type II secretory pathway pseudopilin PulG